MQTAVTTRNVDRGCVCGCGRKCDKPQQGLEGNLPDQRLPG